MQQLEIQYFYPLTEQILLDLDFKPCTDYEERKRKERFAESVITLTTSGMLLSNGGTAWTTVSNNNLGSLSFTINVDAMPITVISKKKPNFIMRFIYKSMGMKWKSE